MRRPDYFNVIEERLNILAYRVRSRGKLNLLDFHGHSEYFYQFLLNEVYSWDVKNENDTKQNVEAIDLIDIKNKFVLQISSVASKQKIEHSLSRDSIKFYKGYTFKFVPVVEDANNLRKCTFKNPFKIDFDPTCDIIDMKSILSRIRSFKIDDQKRVYEFIKKELAREINSEKIESNLATIINILSREDWNKKEAIVEMNSFEIDRKISYNNLVSAKDIVDDYSIHYGRVDKIYAEFDLQGNNKSKSVLSTIRQEYVRCKDDFPENKLFFEVVSKVQIKVLNSSNYIEIPFDELELCIDILVVDAFIRCKIFKNPEGYIYASA